MPSASAYEKSGLARSRTTILFEGTNYCVTDPMKLLHLDRRGMSLWHLCAQAATAGLLQARKLIFVDARGVTAIAFGVSAVVVIGFVGLSTEGGEWYLTRRDAQNAADPAAYAGAVRLAYAQSDLSLTLTSAQSQATATATDVATRNGFTDGQSNTTVTVNTPPASGSEAGNTGAVEVIIQRTVPRLISGFFLASNPVISVRAVAGLEDIGKACILALKKGLTISGNIAANGCKMASNSTSATAINANGTSMTLTDTSLTSTGGCSQCAGTGAPYQTYQPPTTDPDAWLQSISFSKSTCLSAPSTTGVAISAPTVTVTKDSSGDITAVSGQAFCSDVMSSSTSGNLNFSPGTYIFWDSSLKVTGGTVSCAGCTFIFTGDNSNKIGGVDITSNVTASLSAPTSGDFNGILIYRDAQGSYSNGNGNADIQINGGSTVALSGAIYAPSSSISLSGNSSSTSCLLATGSSVNLGGTTNVSDGTCPSSIVPDARSVLLVE